MTNPTSGNYLSSCHNACCDEIPVLIARRYIDLLSFHTRIIAMAIVQVYMCHCGVDIVLCISRI